MGVMSPKSTFHEVCFVYTILFFLGPILRRATKLVQCQIHVVASKSSVRIDYGKVYPSVKFVSCSVFNGSSALGLPMTRRSIAK